MLHAPTHLLTPAQPTMRTLQLQHVNFLLGSAPVGPTTVQRLLRYTGKRVTMSVTRSSNLIGHSLHPLSSTTTTCTLCASGNLPVVRFGSTETCLQVSQSTHIETVSFITLQSDSGSVRWMLR